jgi:hypothetical protein
MAAPEGEGRGNRSNESAELRRPPERASASNMEVSGCECERRAGNDPDKAVARAGAEDDATGGG